MTSLLLSFRNALPLMAYGLGLAVLLRALRLIHHSVVPAAASDEAEELDASPPAPATEAPVDRAEAGRRGAGLLLCWLLVLLPLLPALNILFPVGALLAERLLFLPSVGFCIGNVTRPHCAGALL